MLSFLVAFACTRRFGPIIRGQGPRATVSVVIVLIVAAGLYLAWGYRRASYLSYFVFGLEKGFPFPDPALNSLELWFDARHPVAPGTLKLHGEWPRVMFVLGTAVLVTAAQSGLLIGVLFNLPKEEKMTITRLVGLIVAVTGLTLLTPMLIVIAIFVRISSTGPILIRERRHRGDGTDFSIDQFRTNDLDSDKPTELGRFLRRYSLDHLPALVTLLQGEMTLNDYWNLIREPVV